MEGQKHVSPEEMEKIAKASAWLVDLLVSPKFHLVQRAADFFPSSLQFLLPQLRTAIGLDKEPPGSAARRFCTGTETATRRFARSLLLFLVLFPVGLGWSRSCQCLSSAALRSFRGCHPCRPARRPMPRAVPPSAGLGRPQSSPDVERDPRVARSDEVRHRCL